jgi:hypothetical protein
MPFLAFVYIHPLTKAHLLKVTNDQFPSVLGTSSIYLTKFITPWGTDSHHPIPEALSFIGFHYTELDCLFLVLLMSISFMAMQQGDFCE